MRLREAASGSTTPIASTGRYVTCASPCFSSRRQGSRTARCSVTVVTMWSPFSRYISTTPLIARLSASVPPEVQTSSLGSRAPISRASCSRARSMPPSASQPKEWLRLPGCPNFSVKYGIIASSTRGSTGVVELLSMKIGNLTAMRRLLSVRVATSLDATGAGSLRVFIVSRVIGLQEALDAGLDRQHGPPDVAALELRTLHRAVAAHQAERSLDGVEHLAHADAGSDPGARTYPPWGR